MDWLWQKMRDSMINSSIDGFSSFSGLCALVFRVFLFFECSILELTYLLHGTCNMFSLKLTILHGICNMYQHVGPWVSSWQKIGHHMSCWRMWFYHILSTLWVYPIFSRTHIHDSCVPSPFLIAKSTCLSSDVLLSPWDPHLYPWFIANTLIWIQSLPLIGQLQAPQCPPWCGYHVSLSCTAKFFNEPWNIALSHSRKCWLVVGPPLWKILVKGDDYSQYMGK